MRHCGVAEGGSAPVALRPAARPPQRLGPQGPGRPHAAPQRLGPQGPGRTDAALAATRPAGSRPAGSRPGRAAEATPAPSLPRVPAVPGYGRRGLGGNVMIWPALLLEQQQQHDHVVRGLPARWAPSRRKSFSTRIADVELTAGESCPDPIQAGRWPGARHSVWHRLLPAEPGSPAAARPAGRYRSGAPAGRPFARSGQGVIPWTS